MIEADRFVILGDWDNTPTPEGKLRIIMPPPGRVSGCGWEPFTQQALRVLPQYIKPNSSFCDIGAGTGILTVAASLLGANELYSCEINPDALNVLEKTLQANKVNSTIINGSLPPHQVDVVFVSIGEEFNKKYKGDLLKLSKTLVIVNDDFQIVSYP